MKVRDLDIRHVHVHHVHEWERLCGLRGEEKDGMKNVTDAQTHMLIIELDFCAHN